MNSRGRVLSTLAPTIPNPTLTATYVNKSRKDPNRKPFILNGAATRLARHALTKELTIIPKIAEMTLL